MITATIFSANGARKVEVLDAVDGKAKVTPIGWLGSGYFWDNAPVWVVNNDELSSVAGPARSVGLRLM